MCATACLQAVAHSFFNGLLVYQPLHLGDPRKSAVDDVGEKSRVDCLNDLALLPDRHLARDYRLLHAADYCRHVMPAVQAADNAPRHLTLQVRYVCLHTVESADAARSQS